MKCNYKSCLIQTQFIYDKLNLEVSDKREQQHFLKEELELKIKAAKGKTPEEKARNLRQLKKGQDLNGQKD